MAIEDNIAGMSPQELANLLGNANRLATSGSAKQQMDAARLLPLINAELEERRARAPAKKTAVRKTAAKVAKAPKEPKAPKAKKAKAEKVETDA
jgi:hypothetical protein